MSQASSTARLQGLHSVAVWSSRTSIAFAPNGNGGTRAWFGTAFPRSARAWSRLQADGVSPDRVCGDVVLADYAEVEARWTRTALRSVVPELRNTLTQVAEDANSIVVIADADGVVLWRDGARGVRRPSTHWGS